MRDTDDNEPSGTVVLVCLALSLGLFGPEAYVIHEVAPALSAKGWGIAAAITVGYLLVAQFIRPEPDTSDLGLFGGMVDNPLSYSDEVNQETQATFRQPAADNPQSVSFPEHQIPHSESRQGFCAPF